MLCLIGCHWVVSDWLLFCAWLVATGLCLISYAVSDWLVLGCVWLAVTGSCLVSLNFLIIRLSQDWIWRVQIGLGYTVQRFTRQCLNTEDSRGWGEISDVQNEVWTVESGRGHQDKVSRWKSSMSNVVITLFKTKFLFFVQCFLTSFKIQFVVFLDLSFTALRVFTFLHLLLRPMGWKSLPHPRLSSSIFSFCTTRVHS